MDGSDVAEQLLGYLTEMQALIDEHGWALQWVSDTIPMAYTVGLSRWEHPELLVFGVGQTTAGALLNGLAGRVAAGERLTHGDRPERLFAGDSISALVRVDDTTDLVIARQLYGDGIGALQLVLPDPSNRLPWHDGYEMGWQPLRGSAPLE